jgi:uncharacterized lipoprotein YehR (DUF1307 family)
MKQIKTPSLLTLLVALTFSFTSCRKERCLDCYVKDINGKEVPIEVCNYKSPKQAEKETGALFCRRKD